MQHSTESSIPLSRRELFTAVAALPRAAAERWSPKWDRAIVVAALDRVGAAYDQKEALISRKIGPEYRYHTNLRSTEAHPTRDSLEYALLLLESGGGRNQERAAAIVDRILKLQETDPGGKWYGLWGYYLEEPAPKMSPADWNWADFLGSLLLMIELRHPARLGGPLSQRVHEAIRHASASIRRRNVAMTYTNIAVQGTFVSLAAAELLGDGDLHEYALDRLRRFAGTVDATGSFNEYNSPTYANVTIANLTRIDRMVKDKTALALAAKIQRRAWSHLGRHWHAPTRQLAGPHSRSYSTDIGRPAWIQKALGGELPLIGFDELGKANVPGEIGILDYRCPEDLSAPFLSLGVAHQHRELFQAAPAGVRPVHGTTWLDGEFCLGSVNRGNFWVQSRPLVAYWGGAERPARYLQARVLKDDYDFASALLYSVQEKGYLIGVVNFRHPGGDKHPSLDPVTGGEFRCSRLRLRFELAGVPGNAPILVNREPSDSGEFLPLSAVAADVGGTWLWLRSLGARCGDPAGRLSVAREDGLLTLSVDFLNRREPQTIRWPLIAYSAFLLALREPAERGDDTLAEFDRQLVGCPMEFQVNESTVRLEWDTPAGMLALKASARAAAVAEQDRAFRESLNGAPVPVVRLSDERLV